MERCGPRSEGGCPEPGPTEQGLPTRRPGTRSLQPDGGPFTCGQGVLRVREEGEGVEGEPLSSFIPTLPQLTHSFVCSFIFLFTFLPPSLSSHRVPGCKLMQGTRGQTQALPLVSPSRLGGSYSHHPP